MNTKQKAELLAIAKMAESISFQAGTRIGGRGCDNWLTEQADELAARAQALIADADPEPQVDVAALRALSSSLYQGGHKDIADVIAEALFGDDT
jgi:hypothetical protein